MRRSFLQLVVVSVLATWSIGFIVMAIYGRTLSWTEEKARGDGVFLAYELLDAAPPGERPERLEALSRHLLFGLEILAPEEAEARSGVRLEPGTKKYHKASRWEEWYYLAFTDDDGVLAAGPVNSLWPRGYIPIGLVMAVLLIPLLAGVVALRVERSIRSVERASEALAAGELDARVEAPKGPSTELAARFNAMAERVQQLVKSRDELVQAVSHELGSPLSRLRFHMELLDSQSNERFEERLAAMTRDLDTLDELVSELLSYAQSDATVVNRSLFEPAEGLAHLVELARLEAPESRAIDVDLDAAVGVRVHADPRLFQRAVENVLRNAVRHASGRVLLELIAEEELVRVTVHDDGPGIAEELREKVTAPFFRIEADRSRASGGAGLGLAIVSRIMRQHGGRLDIDASPLGGASVDMHWPNAR